MTDDDLLYRAAYGLAGDLRDAEVFRSRQWSDHGLKETRDPFPAILAEVLRRLGEDPHSHSPRHATIRAAVEDLLAGRRPRW
jgi:hypothetical protein